MIEPSLRRSLLLDVETRARVHQLRSRAKLLAMSEDDRIAIEKGVELAKRVAFGGGHDDLLSRIFKRTITQETPVPELKPSEG